MYSHPLVDVHKLGHRPPLLILYRTLYPRARPLSPVSLFSKNHTRPLQPLTTSRNFQFFRVPRESRLPPGCNVEARDHVSLDRPEEKFHVHLDDSRMRDWAVRDAANVERRDRKSRWSAAHAAGIRGGWNRTRD